jgi:hypothetical protein
MIWSHQASRFRPPGVPLYSKSAPVYQVKSWDSPCPTLWSVGALLQQIPPSNRTILLLNQLTEEWAPHAKRGEVAAADVCYQPTPWRQKPKVHHRIHNIPPTIPILSQMNPPYTPSHLPKIHFDPVLPSTPWSYKWSFSFGLSHQNPVQVSSLSHACHMPCRPQVRTR